MRYGMVGEDDSSDEEKLAKYSGEIAWDYLRPHYQAGVLYFVDPEITLQTVGAAFQADNAPAVETWLQNGDPRQDRGPPRRSVGKSVRRGGLSPLRSPRRHPPSSSSRPVR